MKYFKYISALHVHVFLCFVLQIINTAIKGGTKEALEIAEQRKSTDRKHRISRSGSDTVSSCGSITTCSISNPATRCEYIVHLLTGVAIRRRSTLVRAGISNRWQGAGERLAAVDGLRRGRPAQTHCPHRLSCRRSLLGLQIKYCCHKAILTLKNHAVPH